MAVTQQLVCTTLCCESIYRLFFEIAAIQKYVCLKKPTEMTCCLVPKKRMFWLLQNYFIHVETKPMPFGQGHRDLDK